MIPEKLHEQIPLYVMGELEAPEAAALETLMARSPELRAEVRACAEALAEVAAESAAPVRRSTAMWNVIERRVEFFANGESARPASIRVQHPPRSPVHRGWRVWAWPAAAAVLVLLNLAQWWWWRGRHAEDEPATAARQTGSAMPNDRATDSNQVTPDGATGRGNDPLSLADLMSFDVDHATPEQIRAAYRLLTQKYQRLEKDYVAISENVVPLLWSAIAEQRNHSSEEKTTPGLLSMELRGLTESQPQMVAGLWDRVRDLIGGNAIAIVTDRWRLPGGVVLDPAWWNSRGNTNVGPDPSGFTVDSPPPFALAAVNHAEGLGYLDIYNLPTIPAGQELRLWVQSEGQTDYTAVGNVPPALVGGSGALAFRLPSLTGPPSRFLITTEPIGQSPQPAGAIVIEGP